MGSFSVWHWLIVLVIVLVLFGRGKIPELMGDFAKGIKSFKKGMSDDDATEANAPASGATTTAKTVDHKADEVKETSRS
ncbi:twin-arginine translocase TatA/TatE family subunit [Rhizobium sp. XQZ8]|uniref:twin-arginine translocase TatA/TatE family subunit n=1 Tax=Rhizobium populisoli TaxID=2859785 RepID=UPI001CA5665F|nr:twin-arginine translocase TatA/TatE family subunit [Rhizobium populisoli]MBW6420164.1 twin-arginine translocase TatA/TatE family subunit [Rhizobium populisoli]